MRIGNGGASGVPKGLFVTLSVLLIAACSGHSNDEGDGGDGGEGGEGLEPGTGGLAGSGGTAANGGSGALGGGGAATGGSAGAAECLRDENCPTDRICVDDISGDGDAICESGELCRCVSVRGEGGAGGSGAGGTATGGTATGGTAGRGGGGSGGAPATVLGAPCDSTADCGGAPFVCVTSSFLADGSGPPNGLCTLDCTADAECRAVTPGAYCVGFTDAESYCIEGCRGGAAYSPKCHERPDFACGVIETIPTNGSCVSTADCASGQLCTESVCQDYVSACRPTCGGNFDCARGQFCDFATGFCVANEPSGLPIGSPCDPTLAADPCNGFCVASDDTGEEGTCGAFCSASASAVGCGWSGDGAAEVGCLFATVISRDATGAISLATSDLMVCGKLCDCNAECPASIEFCLDENAGDPAASIQSLFGRRGYCRRLLETETEADTFATCDR